MNDNKHLAVIEKIFSGIEGFDDITCGGLPLGRTTLLMGGPGCPKRKPHERNVSYTS
jgi:circadian clock protein KaiC